MTHVYNSKVNAYLRKAAGLTDGTIEYISNSWNPDTLFCLSFITNNWGDHLNAWVLGKVTNRNVSVVNINYLSALSLLKPLLPKRPICTAIGSIMHYVPDGAFVWGTGCIYGSGNLSINPSAILSVRGPLTAMVLASQGFSKTWLYGDPALLLKKYLNEFSLDYNKRFHLGVIPHHAEHHLHLVKSLKKIDEVLVIDIEEQQDVLFSKISQCEYVLSSSLHGLILCDILEIPNMWVSFRSDFPGGTFKFNDYYSSLSGSSESNRQPHMLYDKEQVYFKDLMKLRCKTDIHEHSINLDDLECTLINHLDRHY